MIAILECPILISNIGSLKEKRFAIDETFDEAVSGRASSSKNDEKEQGQKY